MPNSKIRNEVQSLKNVYLQMASFVMSGLALPFSDQIRAAAKLGYSGVELAGTQYGGMSAAQLKELLDECEITVLGNHLQVDDAPGAIEDMKLLGAQYIVVPGIPMSNTTEVVLAAQVLNALGKIVKEAGMMLGYHNHATEFAEENGNSLLQTLIDHTDPAYVIFECDVGWAAAAGVDVTAFIKKNTHRIRLIHANESDTILGTKTVGRSPREIPRNEHGELMFTPEEAEDYRRRKTSDCPMGKGLPRWKEIIAAASDAQAYIVERRWSYLPDVLDCFAEDLAFMKAL